MTITYSFIYIMKDQIIIICSKIKWHFSLLLIKNGSHWSIIDNEILIYDRPKKLNCYLKQKIETNKEN
jgi:hypothetical protein